MASWLIIAIGVVYFIIAVDLIIKKDYPLGTVFFAYAISNVGLYFKAM